MKDSIVKPNNPPALPNNEQASDSYGMDLRDYFAAKAMQGFLGGSLADRVMTSMADAEMLAGNAYKMADAMLTARNL